MRPLAPSVELRADPTAIAPLGGPRLGDTGRAFKTAASASDIAICKDARIVSSAGYRVPMDPICATYRKRAQILAHQLVHAMHNGQHSADHLGCVRR